MNLGKIFFPGRIVIPGRPRIEALNGVPGPLVKWFHGPGTIALKTID